MGDGRPLFRPEATEAWARPAQGGVRLVRPLSLAWAAAGAATALLLLLAFLFFASYTRKATVEGVLAPDRGLIRVVPAVAGTVLERRVSEGQAVRSGEVLYVLALARPLLADAAQAQVRQSLEARRRSLDEAALAQGLLTAAQGSSLERRQAALRGELAQLESESTLQRQRLVLAEESLARLRLLETQQFISAAQVQAKTEELLALKGAEQALARQRAALEREMAELEGERRALPLVARGSTSGIARERAEAERDAVEQDAEQRLVVRAPQDGTVSTLLAESGQAVSPASALATLVPAGARLVAQLYAPSSAVGFVRPGQEVRLRFQAFPYQRFGMQPARVLQVSRTPLAVSELAALALPAAGTGEPLFRITVALEGSPIVEPLAAGMRLSADVWLERRRLVEWLFEPLLGLRERL